MKIIKLANAVSKYFPKGLRRLDYESEIDGFKDWALLLPGQKRNLWIIVIHGHGSTGGQLYTHRNVRENWLSVFLKSGAGILTVNLRGNSWMGPAAAHDMHAMVGFLRDEYGMQKSIFCSGSMGGTSNLIYGVLYPEDVSGIVARCAASDPATYFQWCRQQDKPILREIAEAIKNSYGGTPDDVPEIYRKHSALHNVDKLVMPVFLSHGGADTIIPVEQSRTLAHKMMDNKNFYYREIVGGDHESGVSHESFDRIIKLI